MTVCLSSSDRNKFLKGRWKCISETRLFLLLGSLFVTYFIIQLVGVSHNLKDFTFRMFHGHRNSTNFTKLSEFMIEYVEDSHTEKRHIAFLKVHKCASSTAQNIFLRFGYNRGLTFLLSNIGSDSPYDNVISASGTLTERNVKPPPPNKTFDILCCHVFYNKEAFRKYMPRDSVYIGIVREPFSQFLSALRYFRPDNVFRASNTSDPILTMLKHPTLYLKNKITNNMMAREYDFPDDMFRAYDEVRVQKYLRKLESEFCLVIVTEYFVESLVLMRRLLGWNLKDILFLNLNVADKRKLILKTNPEQRDLFYQRQKLDTALYRFFHERLWQQIYAQGAKFFSEVLYYRQIQSKVQEFCMARRNIPKRLIIKSSVWNREFTIDVKECQLLMMQEINFIRKIRKRQYSV